MDKTNTAFIESKKGLETTEMDGKYLTFWTNHQLFGMPIIDVVQIIQFQEITEIPEFPAYAKGIINLRGNIIPVIDIRLRLNKPETEYNGHTCIIVTNINDKEIGFIVDGVDEVTKIEDDEISEPPKVSSEINTKYLTGIGKHNNKVILLLEPKMILDENQINMLTSNI